MELLQQHKANEQHVTYEDDYTAVCSMLGMCRVHALA
jgi:hypothetical protein